MEPEREKLAIGPRAEPVARELDLLKASELLLEGETVPLAFCFLVWRCRPPPCLGFLAHRPCGLLSIDVHALLIAKFCRLLTM